MKIFTGTVSQGRIVIEGETLAEGQKVTILTQEGSETFRVSPEEKKLLLLSLAQAQRGEFVDAATILGELDESN